MTRAIGGRLGRAIAPVLTLGALLLACPSPSPSQQDAAPPAPAPSGDCVAACANLKALSCPEGRPSCADVCTHVEDTSFTRLDAVCIAKAKDAASVRACGVKCQKDGGP